MMRSALLLSTILMQVAPPVLSQPEQRTDMGEAAIDGFAYSIDLNADGQISPIEMDSATRQVFTSMDADEDGLVVRNEMIGWENGLSGLAEFRGRGQAYGATMGLVFDMLDADRSGALDVDEHATGLARAWVYADRDGNGMMSVSEFRDNFLVTVALRTALTE